MDSYVLMTDLKQLEETLARHRKGFLLFFKHSTRCPVSSQALDEFQRFVQTNTGKQVPAVVVHVIEHRDVSDAVAEMFGVQHESPQAILLKEGTLCWHTSHQNITASNLHQAVTGDWQKE